MWTWTAILALAFVVQGSLGVPTFGTGPQQEWWNEVDDEFPGEIHQFNDVAPLSDLDDANDEKKSIMDKKISTHSIISVPPTVDPLPAPTPTPRPPTVSDYQEEEESSDKLTSSQPVPITGPPAKDALKYQQSPDIQLAKGKVSLSGAGNLETNEVIKNLEIPPPETKYITTVKPNKVGEPAIPPPLTFLPAFKEGEGHEDKSKEVAKEIDSLSSSKQEEIRQSTSIPPLTLSNTPRSSVGSDTVEEESSRTFYPKETYQVTSSFPKPPVPRMGVVIPRKEFLEYPQSLDLLHDRGEVSRSETGNIDTHELNKNHDHLSLRPKYIVNARPNKAEKNKITSPFTLLRTAKEGEGLEDIFKDVAKVVDLLSSQSEEDVYQSAPISSLPHLNSNVEITDGNKEIFDILSQIQKRLSIPQSLGDMPTYRSDEYGSKDPSREEYVRIKLSPQVQNTQPTKTIKGVLLKSLVPRQYFIIKDIYDILKARAIATSNNEQVQDLFKPDLLHGSRSDERYVAISPEKSRLNNLPRFYLPNWEQELFGSKFESDPEIPDVNEFIEPNFSDDQLIKRHREILKQFFDSFLNRQQVADPSRNQDESDEEIDSGSNIGNIISSLQNQFEGQENSMWKNPEALPSLGRFLLTKNQGDPTKYFRFGSYR